MALLCCLLKNLLKKRPVVIDGKTLAVGGGSHSHTLKREISDSNIIDDVGLALRNSFFLFNSTGPSLVG